jgi:tripartite-type tricarboxylate transporter receptor subunit TctC
MTPRLTYPARVFGLLLSIAFMSDGVCQDYPAKPIQFIVAFPAGGGVDILARAIGQKLSEAWSVPVIIDNRPGAGGNIGTQIAAKAAADGYTITLGSLGTHAVNVSLFKNLPYHPINDFAPVILVSAQPNLLAVHPSLPVRTVGELIRLAKAEPGQLNYASSGNGGPPHLAAELFKAMVNVKLVHVPYKGGPAATTSVVSGETSLTFGTMLNTLPPIRSGRLRGIAVTAAKRSAAVPNLPTVAEAGLAGYEATAWYGVFAPAATPPDVIAKLNGAISLILSDAELKRRLTDEGAELIGGLPERLRDHVRREIDKWAKVVKEAGVKVD